MLNLFEVLALLFLVVLYCCVYLCSICLLYSCSFGCFVCLFRGTEVLYCLQEFVFVVFSAILYILCVVYFFTILCVLLPCMLYEFCGKLC